MRLRKTDEARDPDPGRSKNGNNRRLSPSQSVDQLTTIDGTLHVPSPVEAPSPSAEKLAFALSKAHFSRSIQDYLNVNDGKCAAELASDLAAVITDFSKIYKDVHTVSKCSSALSDSTQMNGSLTVLNGETDLGRFILDAIRTRPAFFYPEDKPLLLLKSPVGAYKNRLLQYICLYLYYQGQLDCAKNSSQRYAACTVLPVYVDLSRYENGRSVELDGGEQITADTLRDKLEDLVEKAANDNREPVIIFDNVRSFECGMKKTYEDVMRFVTGGKIRCRIITGADELIAATNRRATSDLANEENYANAVKITSLNLDRERESVEFIRNCIHCFNCSKSADAAYVRAQFIRLKFVALDAYIVKRILNYMDERAIDDTITEELYYIYERTLNVTDDGDCFREAYLYDYDPHAHAFPKKETWWSTAIEHRSVFDYFVARYYYDCLKNVLCGSGDVTVPDVVLTNSINRFLKSMITDDDWRRLVRYISKNHARLSLTEGDSYGERTIAQLSFLIGRVPKSRAKELSVVSELKLLKEDFEKALAAASEDDPDLKRICCFLLRTVQIGLIKREGIGYLNEYLTTLITDRIAADVNRGYHLDYYGDATVCDKESHPSSIGALLTDLPQKGVNTLRKLCLELERDLDGDPPRDCFCMMVLNLFTYCELLQTRRTSQKISRDDIENHQRKCLSFLDKLFALLSAHKDDPAYRLSDEIIEYFSRVREPWDLKLNKNPRFHELTSGLSRVRTGWHTRGIADAESIAAHMYNAWLMAAIYLPEEYAAEEGLRGTYNKAKILWLLLVHDVGEARIGDIVHGHKTPEDRAAERAAAREYVNQIFPAPTAEVLISLWDDSENEDSDDINARIAKDIDHIQSVYQYCCYVNANPDLFKKEDWNRWTENLNTSTRIGWQIARDAILDNAEFLKKDPLARHIRSYKEQMKET